MTSAPRIDPPVSRASDPAQIHAWIDELERMRQEHGRSPTVRAAIEQEIARAVAWLGGKDELSGKGSA